MSRVYFVAQLTDLSNHSTAGKKSDPLDSVGSASRARVLQHQIFIFIEHECRAFV